MDIDDLSDEHDCGDSAGRVLGKMDIDELSEARREIRQILREGLDLWQAAGKDASRYMDGSYTALVTYDKHPDATYLNRTTTDKLADDIGQLIDM